MDRSKDIRIVYMGTPDFAVYPLRKLVEGGYKVVGVVTVPDKPAGRGLKLTESPVKRYAAAVGLPVLQPEKLRDESFLEALRAWRPELGIVVAFRMLPEAVWALPERGTFNLHASLLPQYRGAAPINWAIINGEKRTGVTTFLLDRRIDTGDIIDSKAADIAADETAGTLHDKLMRLGGELVLETVDRIAAGNLTLTRQSHIPDTEIKAAPKLFKETCRIEWNKSVGEVYDLVRGLSPYPAAWTDLGGKYGPDLSLKIYAARPEAGNGLPEPGTVRCDGKKDLRIACRDGWLAVDELQLPGKKRLNTETFLRGCRLFDGCRS